MEPRSPSRAPVRHFWATNGNVIYEPGEIEGRGAIAHAWWPHNGPGGFRGLLASASVPARWGTPTSRPTQRGTSADDRPGDRHCKACCFSHSFCFVFVSLCPLPAPATFLHLARNSLHAKIGVHCGRDAILPDVNRRHFSRGVKALLASCVLPGDQSGVPCSEDMQASISASLLPSQQLASLAAPLIVCRQIQFTQLLLAKSPSRSFASCLDSSARVAKTYAKQTALL